MKQQVQKAIEEIRTQVQADGGDIELVSVDEDTGAVAVRFRGACVGCPLLPVTLQQGVERKLRERVPAVTKVNVVA